MKKYGLHLFMSFVLLALAPAIAASTYYVSTSVGSDSNTGTEALPWKTIQKACNTAAAGDVVYIKAGTYAENISLNVQGSAAGGYVTFQNYGTDSVVVDGTSVSGDYLMYIDSKSYVKIIGLTFRNCSTTGLPCGIYITGKGNNLLIKNCKVHNIVNKGSDAHGIALYATDGTTPYSNVIFDGNEVYNCKLGSSESMVMNGNVTDFQIINNVVHDNNNIGIDMIGYEGTASANDHTRNGVCRGNTVYNISSEGNSAYSSGDYSADGIYVDGGLNIVIEKNTVHNVNIGIEIGNEHKDSITDSITVRDNIIYSCDNTGIALGGYSTKMGWTIHSQFLNNTLYNNGTQKMGAGQVMIQKSHDNVFKNNIFYCSPEDVAISNPFSSTYTYNNKFDYNVWYYSGGSDALNFEWQNSSYDTYADYKTASGNDIHSLFADPLLVSTSDFHIQATSPAVNAGDPSFTAGSTETDIDGESRISGSRVDIGADEIQTSSGLLSVAADASALSIAPNPMSSEAKLSFDNAGCKTYTLVISNSAGVIVRRDFVNVGTYTLKREGLQPGIYFINLYGENTFRGTLLVK